MVTKLLLADDEAYITTVLGRKLETSFDEIYVANDGEEALALAQQHIPTLVVSDFQMPLMDGFTFATRLKQDIRTFRVPIIMLTARGHLLSAQELEQTNIRHLLAKPFSVKQVVSAVEQLLADEAQRRAA